MIDLFPNLADQMNKSFAPYRKSILLERRRILRSVPTRENVLSLSREIRIADDLLGIPDKVAFLCLSNRRVDLQMK